MISDVMDIAGSWLSGAKEDPHFWTHLTADGRFLATVTRRGDSPFCARVFERKSGAPQWIGTWWTQIERDSLTDCMESAQNVAHEKLQALLE